MDRQNLDGILCRVTRNFVVLHHINEVQTVFVTRRIKTLRDRDKLINTTTTELIQLNAALILKTTYPFVDQKCEAVIIDIIQQFQ